MIHAARSPSLRAHQLSLLAAVSACFGCAADVAAGGASAEAAVPAGEVLATVEFGPNERYTFVEVQPEVVVASGQWHADKPSAMADAVLALPREPATMVEVYERLAGPAALADSRARLAEAQARIDARIARERSEALPGAEVHQPTEPGEHEGDDVLVPKTLAHDAMIFRELMCGKITHALLHHNMCVTNVSHGNYRFYPERLNATQHQLFLFNEQSAGAANVQGVMQYREGNTYDGSWNFIEAFEVAPRWVLGSQMWTPQWRRRVAIGYLGSRYSASEYWWGRWQ